MQNSQTAEMFSQSKQVFSPEKDCLITLIIFVDDSAILVYNNNQNPAVRLVLTQRCCGWPLTAFPF